MSLRDEIEKYRRIRDDAQNRAKSIGLYQTSLRREIEIREAKKKERIQQLTGLVNQSGLLRLLEEAREALTEEKGSNSTTLGSEFHIMNFSDKDPIRQEIYVLYRLNWPWPENTTHTEIYRHIATHTVAAYMNTAGTIMFYPHCEDINKETLIGRFSGLRYYTDNPEDTIKKWQWVNNLNIIQDRLAFAIANPQNFGGLHLSNPEHYGYR